MAQYLRVKESHPDSLLFYRMGDFYEMFFDDAEVAAKLLGITLTKRGSKDGLDVPMCGVPVHSVDGYLAKLLDMRQTLIVAFGAYKHLILNSVFDLFHYLNTVCRAMFYLNICKSLPSQSKKFSKYYILIQ